MKQKFRLYRRKKGGRYYLHNELTGKQESLHTSDRMTATRLLHAKNEAAKQPAINLQIAKAYLAATDECFVKRTWREVMVDFVKVKSGSNRTRAERAVMDKAFDSIRDRQLIETRPEHFLRVLEFKKVSTNNYLRRFHNFAVDMGCVDLFHHGQQHAACSTVDPPPGSGSLPFRIWRVENCLRQK
jgi:hypothetical protein